MKQNLALLQIAVREGIVQPIPSAGQKPAQKEKRKADSSRLSPNDSTTNTTCSPTEVEIIENPALQRS